MNTFERYFADFPKFVDRIACWKPDYFVPVAKKGCKLLKASSAIHKLDPELIKYRSFFELNQPVTKYKKVAVIDDATQFTATLSEYRRYFESLDADVRTYSFVGHDTLFRGHRWKYDEKAEIAFYLPEPVYQEYLLQQSYYLYNSGQHFDLDHFVLKTPLPKADLKQFLSRLRQLGMLLFVDDHYSNRSVRRFSLDELNFKSDPSYLVDASISPGPMKKIKFVYDEINEQLRFSPMVFPTWNYFHAALTSSLFRNVPFALPFKTPSSIDKRNRATLLRLYNNISFCYVAALAKAFVEALSERQSFAANLVVERNDLDAVIGRKETDVVISSIQSFLCSQATLSFRGNGSCPPDNPSKAKYQNFGEVIDDLKKVYEKKIERNKTRIGVHHYATYESLFSKYADRRSLSEELDYCCDFGIIVPETIFRQGSILRACRTGEPSNDYNWRRTQILIPMAIEQIRKETKEDAIGAMALNKVLSNFTYDYPSEHFPELHCLIGKPYDFGTMVHAAHRHRASSHPTIYQAERISPYYKWNGNARAFVTANTPEVIKKIRHLFDEKQQVPYTEILTYFKLLARIYVDFSRTDVLNMLSICREENYFFSHILFNIRTWAETFGYYMDGITSGSHPVSDRLRFLHESGKHAGSASEKLRLAADLPATLNQIATTYGSELDFVKTVEKLQANAFAFTESFTSTLDRLDDLVRLQTIASNLALVVEDGKPHYIAKLKGLESPSYFEMLGVARVFESPCPIRSEDAKFRSAVGRVFQRILILIDSLPAERPMLSARLHNDRLKRARNTLTHIIYTEHLDEIVLLFLDLSGLRDVPEPKEEIVQRFYETVDKTIDPHGGRKLYGGQGGDDEYTILFPSVESAIEAAKDIKNGFATDLFLRANKLDVKFGLGFIRFSTDQKEELAIRCWGEAKDSCLHKSAAFRNRGHLVISKDTWVNLDAAGYRRTLEEFSPLRLQSVTTESPELFLYQGVSPF